MKQTAEALCSSHSPGGDKEGLHGLVSTAWPSPLPSQAPRPRLVNTLQTQRVMAVPRPALALWVGRGVWRGEKGLSAGRGRNKPWLSPSVLCGRFSRSSGLEVGHTGSSDEESSPQPAVSLVSHAWLPSRYSRPLPATLPSLASSALPLNRPGPISLILGWAILSSFH